MKTDLKRIAIIAHVGTGMGHLLRAISLQRLLNKNFDTLLIIPKKSRVFVRQYFPKLSFKSARWPLGHNESIELMLSHIVELSRETTLTLEAIFRNFEPHIVFGVPGFQSSSFCRILGVPHVSVLHGHWLLPEYDRDHLRAMNPSVIRSWRRAIEITDTLTSIVSHALGGRYSNYHEWLESECVCVAQEFKVKYKVQRPTIGFLHTDFGDEPDTPLPEKALTISLGTAVRNIDADVLNVAFESALPVLVVGGKPISRGSGIYHIKAMPGTRLADRSSLTITHGGIGTIPIFAGRQVPQLFIPQDLDQAVNSMLAIQSGWGKTVDLESWSERIPFGRISPHIDPTQLRSLLKELSKMRIDTAGIIPRSPETLHRIVEDLT